jgi:transposase
MSLPPKIERHEMAGWRHFMEPEMKHRVLKRVYTEQHREAAARQVIDAGRSVSEVARSLETSEKTLANRVRQVRRGEAPVNSAAARQTGEEQAELARLPAEDSRLKLDNEILKQAAEYFARESR